jgi:hypothetical protein
LQIIPIIEQLNIPFMRPDMVNDRCRSYSAHLLTVPAKRIGQQFHAL